MFRDDRLDWTREVIAGFENTWLIGKICRRIFGEFCKEQEIREWIFHKKISIRFTSERCKNFLLLLLLLVSERLFFLNKVWKFMEYTWTPLNNHQLDKYGTRLVLRSFENVEYGSKLRLNFLTLFHPKNESGGREREREWSFRAKRSIIRYRRSSWNTVCTIQHLCVLFPQLSFGSRSIR